MKKVVLVFLAFFSLYTASLAGSWVQKDGYLELNNSSDTLKWLKLSPDGKLLYAFTNRGILKKIDVQTGDMVKLWKDVPDDAKLNTDDESIFIHNKDFDIIRKSLDSENVIYTIYPTSTAIYPPNMSYQYSIMLDQVVLSKNNTYLVSISKWDGYVGGQTDSEKGGRIELRRINDGTVIDSIDIRNRPCSIALGSDSIVAFSGWHLIQIHHDPTITYSYINTIYKNIDHRSITPDGLGTNETASGLSFSKDNKILLGIGNSKFNLWDVNTGKLIKSYLPENYSNVKKQVFFLQWSNNSKIFLYSYSLTDSSEASAKKSIIKFYNANLEKPVDSLVFNGSDQNYSICFGSDSTSFFTISRNNIIRWFKPDILSTKLKAFFITDKTIILPGDTTHFSDGSIGNPTDYLWDFGDGTSSTSQNPFHVYTKPGKFDVKLIVSKNSQHDTALKTRYIVVNSSLKADFEADVLSGDPTLTVHFTNKSTGDIKSYSWDFYDGTKGSDENPVHTFDKPGIYPIMLIAFDGTHRDTLVKYDYIKINSRSVISSDFEREMIKELPYLNIEGTTALESGDNGFFAEGFNYHTTTLFHLDNTFNIKWSQKFTTGSSHKPMKKSNDDNYFFIGVTTDKSYLKLNRLNNLNEYYSVCDWGGDPELRDFTCDSIGCYFAQKCEINHISSTYINYAFYRITNNSKVSDLVNLWPGTSDLDTTYQLKLTTDYMNYIGLYINETYYTLNSYYYYERHNNIVLSKFNYNLYPSYGYKCTFYSKKLISFNFPDTNNSIVLFSDRMYFCKGDTNFIFFDIPSNFEIKSILATSPDNIILCGSKNGYCWYGYMNDSGKITFEHTITERPGCLNSAFRCKDKSIIFSGVNNKNNYEKYLYLYKTKPVISDSPGSLTNISLIIYPNPANDELIIKTGDLNIEPSEIKIINSYGEFVSAPEKINNVNGESRLTIRELPVGMYFIKIRRGTESIIGKFTVIR